MDRNQQFHSSAFPSLTEAGEFNLKDVLRKQGTKSHLQPRSSSFRWIARNGWKLASKCLKKSRHFDYLFLIQFLFFPTSVREKGWRDVRLCDPKSQSSMENIMSYSSTVEFTKMWCRNWSTKRINSWNLVIMNFAHIVRNIFFSASSFKLCFPNIIWLISFICMPENYSQ